MSDELERAFLDAIASNPEDVDARAVYADWLEQRGDVRGEYLRLEAQLHSIPKRLGELAPAIEPGWLLAVAREYAVEVGNPGSNKIGVIKVVRQYTGLGLKDSKDIVDSVSNDKPYRVVQHVNRGDAEKVLADLRQAGAQTRIVGQAFVGPAELAIANSEIVLVRVLDGRKIETIKLVRELTGLGLKDAKDLVERAPVVIARGVDQVTAIQIVARFAGVGELRVT